MSIGDKTHLAPALGVVLSTRAGWSTVRDLARRAEDLAVGSVWFPDRFSDGAAESLTIMSAVAASTERIQVGAYMLNASLRDPALLAKVAATLDGLAPGRIRIVLGTGWDRSDYEALGSEFPPPDVRTQRTEDALSILKRETSVAVEVAGVRDDLLTLAASRADGWSLSSDALDAYFERVAFLRRACEEAGRSFDELHVSCTLPSVKGIGERIADLSEHEMREFRVVLNGNGDGDGDQDRLERLVEALAPRTG